MTAGEWEEIKRLFEAALELEEPERTAFLDAACETKPFLRQTVADLITNYRDAEDFLPDSDVTALGKHVFSDGQLVAGRFRITKFVSRGGMGEVYEAYDEKLHRKIALKTLRREFAAESDACERFRREICVAQKVRHHSICSVYDLVEHRDPQAREGDPNAVITCLSMELLEGQSLQAYLAEKRPLTPQAALPLIAQIAAAIDLLHQHGLLHRDIKPSNIMLAPDGEDRLRAVVMDFGLAKLIDAGPDQFNTKDNLQAGAPYFVSPELLRGEKPSIASDLYALGMLVDEMVTATRAFNADCMHSLYYQKLWEAPVPPGQRSKDLPANWERAILRCLNAEPKRRYQRATEFLADLELPPVPVAPPTLFDRFDRYCASRIQRLVAHHRFGLRGAAFTVPAIIGGLIVASLIPRSFTPSPAPIVVYPISNLSGEADHAYLSKGITQELMRRLSQNQAIRVIPFYETRTASSPAVDGAEFSVEGQLQSYRKRIRLTIQVKDEKTGSLVWVQNFERQLENHLELQSEIVNGVIQSLDLANALDSHEPLLVLPVSIRRLLAPLRQYVGLQSPTTVGDPPTISNAALEHYMRGRDLWDERTLPGALAAIEQFNLALKEDPNYAHAYSALADVQFTLMEHKYAPQLQLLERARQFAERAIAANPALADGYVSLGAVRQQQWEWKDSEANYLQAIRLSPKMARAHHWYAGLLVQFGRFDESLQQAELAVQLDRYNYPAQSAYGVYLFNSGRYRDAVSQLEGTLAKKDQLFANVVLGNVYAKLGSISGPPHKDDYFRKAFRQAEIVASRERQGLREISSAQTVLPFSDGMYALYFALAGKRSEAMPYVEKLSTQSDPGRIPRVLLAGVYAALGEQERAIGLLEQAADNRDKGLLLMKVSPLLESLRPSIRFQALQQRMQL